MPRWSTEQMKAAEAAFRDFVAPRIKVEDVSQKLTSSHAHWIEFQARHVNQAKGRVFAVRTDRVEPLNPAAAAREAANATIKWMTEQYGAI